jgi:hypothetical protein
MLWKAGALPYHTNTHWIEKKKKKRLLSIANRLVPSMTDVQIIPPPKEVDPRVLVWKGAAVLGKMEGVSDLWLTVDNWVRVSPSLPSRNMGYLFRLQIFFKHKYRTCWACVG